MRARPLLEIAVQTLDEALAAADAGADRLELCADLDHHGYSPPCALISTITSRCALPILAMLRPRTPDAPSRGTLARLALDFVRSGAAGIVFGPTTPDGSPDMPACLAVAEACPGSPLVYHRAFDLAPDPAATMHTLARIGVTRILSAGLSPHETRCVLENRPPPNPTPMMHRLMNLRSLVRQAADRIEILPCGGIRDHNAHLFLEATGGRHVHAACRQPGPSGSQLDVSAIRALRRVLDQPL
ncbi:MAG: hypothetical protein KF866_10950 [Phycisphaeraceae bacterium]|nr:hypothetical protein [Phycisphaeraceae bacterium]MCW5754305.1 hypothetical protein [Phycisphaeraceae bacterium]